MQGGIYDSISPLFPPLVEQLKMVNTTHWQYVYKKVSHNFPMRVFVWEK